MRRPPPAWLPVAAATAASGWALRSELDPGHYPHDGSFHLAYVRWAAQRISHGDSPLDGVFPDLGLGFPIFQHYQVLPHLLSALPAWLLGAGPTVAVTSFLLLALWPVCTYASARLFELDRTTAAAAAVLAPLVTSVPGYGFELPSYVWRGHGMWAQSWGMWLFALAAGWSWGAVVRRRSLAVGALLLAATCTTHLLTGLWLAAVIVVWPLLATRDRRRAAAGRAAALLGGGGIASAWLLVPSFVDRAGTAFENPDGTFWRDSHGVGQVTTWIATGGLFDSGRLPVLTALLAVGLAVAARRRTDGERALLAMFATSLVLFCGSDLVGPVLDHLPAREILFLHRAIVGVHFAGILLAAVGATTLLRALPTIVAALPRRAPGAVARLVPVVACGLVLVGPVRHLGDFFGEQDRWVGEQRAADRTDGRDFDELARLAAAQGGRIYAGSTGDWGRNYRIGYVPGYIRLLELGVPGVGFSGRVPAITERSEAGFDAGSRAQAEVFDVRWQLRPAGVEGPPGARRAATRGRHNLWRLDTTGPVQLADPLPAVAGGDGGPAVASAEFLRSDLAIAGRYPLLTQEEAAPAGTATAPPAGKVGEVWTSHADLGGQHYAATVEARRPAVLVVKTSAHPRWTALVDGAPASIRTVAPGLLAVDVPPGSHHVEVAFTGFPVPARLVLAVAGVVALGILAFADRRKFGCRARPAPAQLPSCSGPSARGGEPVMQPTVLLPSRPAGADVRQ